MIDDRDIFERFHSAFDVQPSPGAAQRLRSALLDRSATPGRSPIRHGIRISLRLAAGLTLIAVAIAITGVFFALHAPTSRVVPSQTPASHGLARTSFGMVSPTVGWEETTWIDLNNLHHILRTTDAGAHWRDVSPPATLLGADRPSENYFAQGTPDYFLDANHVWITETVASDTGFQVFVLRTSDGGATWRRSSSIVGSGFIYFSLKPYFLDPNHGWLLMKQQVFSSDAKNQDALYRTSDGGMTWTQVALNVFTDSSVCGWDEPAFASANNGWLLERCPGELASVSRLLMTHDGGETWSLQTLPCQCDPRVPVVFDRASAMVPTSGPEVLMTSDAGATWSTRTLPGQTPSVVDFLDSMHGWVVDGANLYRTSDGGYNWLLFPTPLPFTATDLYFVDLQHGFAENTASPSNLLKTTDGGKTWSVLGSMPPRGY